MFDGLFMPAHLIVVLAVVLIVFGPGKLPELGETLGRAIRDFKKTLEGTRPDGETKRVDEK
jgi:sec-independent protein translocase protein TatA